MLERSHITDEAGREIFPFVMGYLPEFFQRKAEIELHDTPENREKGIKVLRGMLENDKHFIGMSFDDDFLLQYLRGRKFNINRAFSQIKSLINLRKRYKNVFSGFCFENIVVSLQNEVATFLPYRCQDGCAILLVQLDNWDPVVFPIEDIRRMVALFILQAFKEPMTQVNGFKAIFDVKSNPIRHLRHATPTNMYLMHHATQESTPARIKAIHVVNNSLSFRAAWAILKNFVGAKFKSRMHFHDTPETLVNFFPASILPVHYGGQLKDYDMTDWLKDIMSPEKLATFAGGNHSE